jgi:cytochrome c oxidase accessory protein FixG
VSHPTPEAARVHLPILPPTDPSERRSSLRRDGTRVFVHQADVRGRFHTARRIVFAALIALWIALPMIRIHGRPALFLDIEKRTFFILGGSFNAQDAWLLFFLLTGVAFALAFATAFLGRVWCGWACPQTVFLDGVYRVVERWIDGPATTRIRLAAAPWGVEKVLRRAAKHAAFLMISFAIAHMFLAYFVSLPGLFSMMRGDPGAHPEAFGWAVAVTFLLYGNFAWFREQLCLFVCPYGRLQSALIDAHTVNVAYDGARGEPRGKATDPSAGACVACNRCVAVCPTGIDIREGLQLDCIACTACIDACDEVMDKLARPRGLIRYASQEELRGGKTRWVRPRTYVYGALLIAGCVASLVAASRRTDFEVNVLRPPGASYLLEATPTGEIVRDVFQIRIYNKSAEPRAFTLSPPTGVDAIVSMPQTRVVIAGNASATVPLAISIPRAKLRGPRSFEARICADDAPSDGRGATLGFLGPTAAR